MRDDIVRITSPIGWGLSTEHEDRVYGVPEVAKGISLDFGQRGNFNPTYDAEFMHKELGRVKHPDLLTGIHSGKVSPRKA